ncbi:MAG: hypothetical protein ACLVEX_09280 [Ruthenibacterium lactatiformans]
MGGRGLLWVAGYIRAGALQSASRPFSVWQLVLTAFLLLEVGVFFYIVRKLISQPINRFAGEVQNLEKEGVLQLAEKPNNDMDFLYQAFLGVSGKLKAALEQACITTSCSFISLEIGAFAGAGEPAFPLQQLLSPVPYGENGGQ